MGKAADEIAAADQAADRELAELALRKTGRLGQGRARLAGRVCCACRFFSSNPNARAAADEARADFLQEVAASKM